MAMYRFSIRPPVSRGKGKSVIAGAAYQSAQRLSRTAMGAASYQSGELLQEEADGQDGNSQARQTFDYRRRQGVLHTEIIAPTHAPAWTQDRERLWNEVDRAETRINSQLARPLIISLPHELTRAQNIALVREFMRSEFVDKGMIADLAVHKADRDGDLRNVHAHVLLTMRDIGPDGFSKHKRRDWNDRELGKHWRVAWADHANRALEAAGSSERIDHRSLKDRGLDREPEAPIGPKATEMARNGRTSYLAEERKAIKDRNRRRTELAAQRKLIAAELREIERMPDDPVSAETRRQGGAAQVETDRQAQAAIDQQERLDKAGREWKATDDAKRAATIEAQAPRNRDDLVKQTGEMSSAEAEEKREAPDRFERLKTGTEQTAERARQQAAASQRGRGTETDINDPGTRYAIALDRNYSIVNPYETLAKSAMAEYALFMEQREQLTHAIANAADPESRRKLEMRREIEGLEYLAITGERIAVQSEVITGRTNSPEAVRMRALVSGDALTEEKAAKLFEKQRMEPEAIKAFVESVTRQQEQQGGGWALQARALRVEYREQTQARPGDREQTQNRPGGRAGGDVPGAPATKSEPWMQQPGGYDKLAPTQKQSAEKSYASWAARNPRPAKGHDLRAYVAYVQDHAADRAAVPQRPSNRVDLSKISEQDRKRIKTTDSKALSPQERQIQRRMLVAEQGAVRQPRERDGNER
jgi:hypothetical protein